MDMAEGGGKRSGLGVVRVKMCVSERCNCSSISPRASSAANTETGLQPPSKRLASTLCPLTFVLCCHLCVAPRRKAVRGQGTKKQKLRKAKLAEKAEARAEKTVVRAGAQAVKKGKKVQLKHMY
jgi:hypothetical protein